MGSLLQSLLACIASAGMCAAFLILGVPADGFSSTSWLQWGIGGLILAHLVCLFTAFAMASGEHADLAPMVAGAPAALLLGGLFLVGQAFSRFTFL